MVYSGIYFGALSSFVKLLRAPRRTTKSFMPVRCSLLLKADKCHPQSACTEIIMRGTSEHVTALYHSDIPF